MRKNKYSKSKIDTFKKCKLQYKKKYIEKIKLPQPHSDDLQFGSWIHKCLEIYNPDTDNKIEVIKLFKHFDIRGKAYINAIPQTLRNAIAYTKKNWKYPRENEQTITYEGEKITVTGIVDLKMEQKNGLVIVDYKSSKTANPWRHEYQMKMYTYMFMKIESLPAEKIHSVIYYPRIDDYNHYNFTTMDMKLFEQELMQDIVDIETTKVYPASPGYHCRWCPYLDTEHCSKGQKP